MSARSSSQLNRGPRVWQQRTERLLPLLALGRAHHAHRPVGGAVVGATHGDHLGAGGVTFGEFQRPLDRLGARVDEIDALQRRGQRLGEAMRELHLRTFDQLAVNHHVHVVCGLTSHGLHHGGVGVADVVHRHARHEVVIAFAFGGVEEYALGARHLDHHRRRRGLAHMRQKPFSQYLAHKLSCSVSYAVRRRRQDCASLGELQSAAWGGGELPISQSDIE